jgi:hypothetical protein
VLIFLQQDFDFVSAQHHSFIGLMACLKSGTFYGNVLTKFLEIREKQNMTLLLGLEFNDRSFPE